MWMNRCIWLALAGVAIASASGLGASFAYAQNVNDAPISEVWWPSEFGPEDKAGAINRITPESVIRAMKLVRTGRTATLGKYYDSEIPLGGSRIWNMVLPGTPAAGPLGRNQVVAHDEYVSAEIGQVGTQFDGPGHIGVRTSKGDLFYNGREREATYQRDGFGRPVGMGDLGVEHVAEKAFVCRAVILDAAKYRGVDRLPVPTTTDSPGIITADDVKSIVEAQDLKEIEAGDCVFLHTGHGDLWKNSIWKSMNSEQRRVAREEFSAGEPGFGRSACEYLAARKISLMGGDTSSNEAMPVGEVEGEIFPCHQIAQAHHGIWNIENLDLEPLVREGVYEFLFVWSPLRIVGATGSPGNPVAIW
jgi:kynurenine formamidase